MIRNIILGLVILGIVSSIYFLETNKVEKSVEEIKKESAINITTGTLTTDKDISDKATKYAKAKELVSPDGFINTGKDFTIQSLVGKKVILIDFWTYSCINCQRTIPYLNAWYDKYKKSGLEIVGVHSPEFEFEKKYDNVAAAVQEFGIKYPVVQDNNMFTWRAYENQYWPREYLIDIDGYIVHDHAGEGEYDVTEKRIQDLLAERNARLGIREQIASDIVNPKNAIPMDEPSIGSPEVYFGAARNEYLANGASGKLGVQDLKLPQIFDSNKLYLEGSWDFSGNNMNGKFDGQFAQNQAGAKIVFKYKAKNVYFVASSDAGVKIKITKDGKFLTAEDKGADIAVDSTAIIKGERLYKLIENKDYGEHTLQIEIDKAGLKAFTFTFG